MKIELSDKMLLAYLEGEVTQSQAAAIEAALADAPAERRRLEALRRMLGHLSSTPAELDAIDLVPRVRQAIATMPAAAPRRGRGWPLLAAAAMLLVAASTLVAGGRMWPLAREAPVTPSADELRVKSDGEIEPAAALDRWVGITAYQVVPGAPPRRVDGRVRQGDGLLFAFDNLGRAPFDHLMIFAVDSAGLVYWFYPAYEDAASDPASISIRGRGSSAVELPDLIHHDVPAGPLAIYGVFTRAPLRVSEVERAIAALVRGARWDPRQPPRLPIPGAGQQILPVRVEP